MKNSKLPQMPLKQPEQDQYTDLEMLQRLQRDTFGYFTDEATCKNGLIADKTQPGSVASIAATGLGLSSYAVGVERGYITREDAIDRTLKILRFFRNSRQGREKDATGYKGFYYHFLDMETGKRAWSSEVSTVDTAILIAGMLTSASYFTNDTVLENEIRQTADELYRRVDWKWALNKGQSMTHGWKPGRGFIKFRWDSGYSEAHILYILALGSPTYPIDKACYDCWVSTFELKNVYGTDYIYAGPLFIHQMSHMWLDFRNIHDDLNRKCGIDYFENSHRAVCVQQEYAIRNPMGYERYGPHCWGLSASDGPGPARHTINGVKRKFYDYIARGVPDGPDDGTVSPWAVVASLPFSPEIVLDTIRHIIEQLKLTQDGGHMGLHASFNATYPKKDENPNGWVSKWQFGLNQGPVVIMTENYLTGMIWKIMSSNPYIRSGLKKAGFAGGWLDNAK